MTHPVVIMAYDKSPAISKAVSALEEAGLEVRVLNTKTSRLVEFLGALAGEDEDQENAEVEAAEEPAEDAEDTEDATEKKPVQKTAKKSEQSDDISDADIDALKVKESLNIYGEQVKISALTDGPSELTPTGLMVGAKTAYAVNESHFAFWPVQLNEGLYDLTHQIQLQYGAKAIFENVKIVSPATTPSIKLNRTIYNKLVK